MSSALDIVNDGATFAGVGDLYNSLASEESSLALRLLNNLLDIESTQEYTIYNSTEGTLNLSVGVAQYLTSLLGANVNPSYVERMTVVDASGFTHDMREVGVNEWANITYKAQPGRPYRWFYNQNAPASMINVWPTPSFAGDVLHVWYGTPLQQFTTLSSVLVAPDGFELYLKTNLGAMLAMWFRKQLTDEQRKAAKQWREFVRVSPLKVLAMPVPTDNARYGYNIYTDNQ